MATEIGADHSEKYLFPEVPDSCELTIACRADEYSASRIARAIEDCDAHVLNLNVTSSLLEDGEMTVALRAGLRNADSAVRALERYGYRVVAVDTPIDNDDNTLGERINELMTHLKI